MSIAAAPGCEFRLRASVDETYPAANATKASVIQRSQGSLQWCSSTIWFVELCQRAHSFGMASGTGQHLLTVAEVADIPDRILQNLSTPQQQPSYSSIIIHFLATLSLYSSSSHKIPHVPNQYSFIPCTGGAPAFSSEHTPVHTHGKLGMGVHPAELTPKTNATAAIILR